MDKVILEKLIAERKSTRRIAEELETSQTNVRYWLKRFGLSTSPRRSGHNNLCCGKCGETDPTKFYGVKYRLCGRCHNRYTIEAGRKKRAWAVAQLGGKCKYCGYDRCIQSLDFHHTDPTKKDPHFGSLRGWSKERILRELASCELVCRNCHGEIHAGVKQGIA